jgi:hypothetical protein
VTGLLVSNGQNPTITDLPTSGHYFFQLVAHSLGTKTKLMTDFAKANRRSQVFSANLPTTPTLRPSEDCQQGWIGKPD